jgi:hypothetical protein
MGRAMLIICLGLVIVLGYTMIGSNNQAELLTATNAGYANRLKAQNAAQMAIQFGIDKINSDSDFSENHASKSSAWNDTIEGAETNLWVETISQITNDSGLEEKTFRITAESEVQDQQAKVISVYEKNQLHFVPEFKSVISLTNDNFTFLMTDSASLSGSDPIGGCANMPGIITSSETDSSQIVSNATGVIQGDPPIKVDNDISFSSISELTTYLDGMSGVEQLSGNYMGALGDTTKPGVFFVNAPTDIKSDIDKGYGILVIRDEGRLYYQGDTDIANQLTFSGLVVFENAQDFKTETTPSISGSVVVGSEESSPALDIVLDGSIQISHNCEAQKYARMASALIFDEDSFRRVVTFE